MEAVRAPSAACADVRDHHPRSWREPGTAEGTAQSRGLSARACPVRASGIVVSARSAHLETALGTRAPPGGPCAFRAGAPLFRAGELRAGRTAVSARSAHLGTDPGAGAPRDSSYAQRAGESLFQAGQRRASQAAVPACSLHL